MSSLFSVSHALCTWQGPFPEIRLSSGLCSFPFAPAPWLPAWLSSAADATPSIHTYILLLTHGTKLCLGTKAFGRISENFWSTCDPLWKSNSDALCCSCLICYYLYSTSVSFIWKLCADLIEIFLAHKSEQLGQHLKQDETCCILPGWGWERRSWPEGNEKSNENYSKSSQCLIFQKHVLNAPQYPEWPLEQKEKWM